MKNIICQVQHTRKDSNSFAVMLKEAPRFPDNKAIKKDVKPYIVIAANDDTGKWGWCTLNKQEKNCVGNKLVSIGMHYDKWVWCNIFER